ncbi:MAG: hypothetical protein BWZ10_01812 [candidate division BRC1 bacterium ADurb.BinA364]|nr:MAG: hypothetical protein BWZ10_01812 [candidate division BRC1 bacterium ADurb.BinA364]
MPTARRIPGSVRAGPRGIAPGPNRRPAWGPPKPLSDTIGRNGCPPPPISGWPSPRGFARIPRWALPGWACSGIAAPSRSAFPPPRGSLAPLRMKRATPRFWRRRRAISVCSFCELLRQPIGRGSTKSRCSRNRSPIRASNWRTVRCPRPGRWEARPPSIAPASTRAPAWPPPESRRAAQSNNDSLCRPKARIASWRPGRAPKSARFRCASAWTGWTKKAGRPPGRGATFSPVPNGRGWRLPSLRLKWRSRRGCAWKAYPPPRPGSMISPCIGQRSRPIHSRPTETPCTTRRRFGSACPKRTRSPSIFCPNPASLPSGGWPKGPLSPEARRRFRGTD